MYTNVERAVRYLRLRRRWPQRVLGARAGVSRETISRLERGDVAGMTLGNVDRIARMLGGSLHLQIRWQGERLDRLMDEVHAALQAEVAQTLATAGWDVRVESSFNHYGDRGRVDVLAHQAQMGTLLVVEVKSAFGDLQETLGRLDVKVRLAHHLARDLGWGSPTSVVPALVVGDSRLARRTVRRHDALFARYGLRGRTARAWLRTPQPPAPSGLLWFAKRPDSRHATVGPGRRAPKGPGSRHA